MLFDRTRIDPALAGGREDLYRHASRYAQKFCRRLERSLRDARGESEGEVLAELRRFYRLTNARKLAHIERMALITRRPCRSSAGSPRAASST